MFCFSRANHESTNLKKFWSSKLDKFTLFTYFFVGWNLEHLYKQAARKIRILESIFLQNKNWKRVQTFYGSAHGPKVHLSAKVIRTNHWIVGNNVSFLWVHWSNTLFALEFLLPKLNVIFFAQAILCYFCIGSLRLFYEIRKNKTKIHDPTKQICFKIKKT